VCVCLCVCVCVCVCVCNKLRGMGALLEGTRVAHVTSEARVKNSAKKT